jgi:peptide/nickel transport system ATP-binding protein
MSAVDDELPAPPALTTDRAVDKELLSVERLSTTFFTRDGHVPAVRNVSFRVRRGEVLGLVGESGSGKSITARSIIGLVPPPGRIVDGRIMFKGRDLVDATPKQLRAIRGAEMSMVLQEPMSSLNPLLTIGDQVAEMFTGHPHRRPEGKSVNEAVVDILRRVHIPDPLRRQSEYPMHFSGGMRQRVAIAMAAALSPDLIIADEPTTALDVTIQAQMLDLLLELRDQLGTGMLFITHDMGVVAQICDSVAVMYAGQIVEYTDVFTLFERPSNPYTQALLRSLPTLDERRDRLPSIAGHPPDIMTLGTGCPFADRCEHVFDRCRVEDPPLFQVSAKPVVHSRCWLHEDTAVRNDGTATTEPVSDLALELEDVDRFEAPAQVPDA